MDRENLLNELMVAEDCIAAQDEQLSSLRDQINNLKETIKSYKTKIAEGQKLIESLRWANALLSWKDEPYMQGLFSN